MCQMRGTILRSTFLKNAKGRPFHFSLVQHYLFFSRSKLSQSRSLVPVEKSLLVDCHPLDDPNCPGPITANVTNIYTSAYISIIWNIKGVYSHPY